MVGIPVSSFLFPGPAKYCWSKFINPELMAHVDATCAVVSVWPVRPAEANETDRTIVVDALYSERARWV